MEMEGDDLKILLRKITEGKGSFLKFWKGRPSLFLKIIQFHEKIPASNDCWEHLASLSLCGVKVVQFSLFKIFSDKYLSILNTSKEDLQKDCWYFSQNFTVQKEGEESGKNWTEKEEG